MITSKDTLLYMQDGKYKLDVETGEWIKVCPYVRRKIRVTAKLDDGTEKEYVWNASPVDDTNIDDSFKETIIADGRGRKPNVHCNNYILSMLQPCQHINNAKLTFPFLEDTLTAVGGFHDGSKPISIHVLYRLLSTLEGISTSSVQNFTGYSERYCRKLAKALKVASTALTSQLLAMQDVQYVDSEVPMVSDEQCKLDRAEYVQWVAEQQLLGKYEGFTVLR